ncbi:GNAT family N-acetyltransferase [Ktedonosporobacter rubrisoli]|nr:GNAT family N-acetyltransferase [Ktedonosporobacter rubrisoli]
MSIVSAKQVRLKTGKTIDIRSAQTEDARQVLMLAHSVMAESAFLLTTPEEFRYTIEDEKLWIQNVCASLADVIILAENDHQLIGMLNFMHGVRKRIAHQGELGMSVAAQWRGQGVGKALLQSLIEWGEAHPLIEKLCLQVFASNTRAIALYTSLGFEQEGRLKRQIKLLDGTYVDLLAMARFVK